MADLNFIIRRNVVFISALIARPANMLFIHIGAITIIRTERFRCLFRFANHTRMLYYLTNTCSCIKDLDLNLSQYSIVFFRRKRGSGPATCLHPGATRRRVSGSPGDLSGYDEATRRQAAAGDGSLRHIAAERRRRRQAALRHDGV